MATFRDTIDVIVDSQAVDALTANRPLLQLLDNTRYLRQTVESATDGSGIYDRAVPIVAGVAVGQPVYYDVVNLRYDLAVADGTAAALVAGVCTEKATTTTGTVLLYGRATVDILPAIVGPVVPGRYWLSPAVAGRLVSAKPTSSTLVLVATDDGAIYVSPQVRDLPAPFVSAVGDSVNADTTLATLANTAGVVGVGTIKNTGANGLIVREEVTDAFGVSSSAERTVATTASAPLQLSVAVGTALPPYTAYVVKVRSAVADDASGYALRLSQAVS